MAADPETIFCARHPSVETVLRCGRCETPICPKCVVFTDVGARCPTCAPMRKLPQLELSPVWIARGAGAAVGVGLVAGGLWGLLLPDVIGLVVVLIGAGVGYVVGESVAVATNRKSGPALQTIAAIGAVIAFLVYLGVSGHSPTNDIWRIGAALAAIFVAVGRLQF
jgi:B-box zinc finger.